MATYNELENVMKRYIDSDRSNRAKRRDSLKELLKNESVDSRYRLLMNVRGAEYNTWAGVYAAAWAKSF